MKNIEYELIGRWLNRLYNKINSEEFKVTSLKELDHFSSTYVFFIALVENIKDTLRFKVK